VICRQAYAAQSGDVHRVSRRAVTDEDVLTPEDIQKLLRHATAGLPYTLRLTAAATGCRHNELLALRWQDIDFEGAAIHVRRSLTWVREGQGDAEARVAKFYPPKTDTGRRRIPAPPELLQALRRWFLQTHFKAAGDLVFPTRTGQPSHHRTVRRDVLERTRKRAKVRKFTMHSLRHSFASSLLQGGASIAEVQKYMGHKNASRDAERLHALPAHRGHRCRRCTRPPDFLAWTLFGLPLFPPRNRLPMTP
jgi:integrase